MYSFLHYIELVLKVNFNIFLILLSVHLD